ncbi:hypothetical protein F4782DRAFT_413968 [Xylaria castorea]|nr:hypothetical protein F4782DRAFT_413968 [Xylaria castorea]
MNSNPRESQALNNQRPSVHSYGYNPVPTLQERIHSVFSTPLPHNPCSYQDSLFTDLLEVRITLPSVSYLRANQGRHFGSVPPEILRTYTHRAITETDHHHAAVAFPPDIHPRESAWWMVGDVLRVVGDSLDSEVTSWWESASMSARGSRSSQASSTGRSAPYSICSSDRFSLSFRTLNDGDGVVEEATTRHSTLDRLGRGPGQGSSNGASSLACEL